MTAATQSSIAVRAVGLIVISAWVLTACSSSDSGEANAPASLGTAATTTTVGASDSTNAQEVAVTDGASMTTSSTSESVTAASTSDAVSSPDPGGGDCAVGPVPVTAGLDPFYTQGCQVDGFWVVAGEVVDPMAVIRAADTVTRIFATDDRLAPALVADGIRLGVIGRDQRTTEMPEYRDLHEAFPETDWDSRARGLGATLERPLVSAGEENVRCLPDDLYFGEDILLHEFSHVLHQFGYRTFDPDFDTELFAAYGTALQNGTWDGTYAATNADEYWAEGVQSYLGRNLSADPVDGIHGPIDTKGELRAADPALFALIDDRLNGLTLPPHCR